MADVWQARREREAVTFCAAADSCGSSCAAWGRAPSPASAPAVAQASVPKPSFGQNPSSTAQECKLLI